MTSSSFSPPRPNEAVERDVNYNFEWDIKKTQANPDKHGVSFEEAAKQENKYAGEIISRF